MWCKINSKELPDSEIEMLRHLYACLGDHTAAYASIEEKYDYHAKIFPIKFNENKTFLLNCGGIYIHGRDKCFRPVVMIRIF
jgi:hypothetical protein